MIELVLLLITILNLLMGLFIMNELLDLRDELYPVLGDDDGESDL